MKPHEMRNDLAMLVIAGLLLVLFIGLLVSGAGY